MKTFAFYLPQFHPIAENDEWWGKGFTEWRNVAACKPRFPGHRQPQLPADLGFYDLRLDETRDAQAELAKAYGVDGFIYYHYWFNGKRLLEKPVEKLIQSDIDFPFALCWANENWTRAWDGQEHQVLMQQVYSESDNQSHVDVISQYFADRRYIKINGRPLFLIYRPEKVLQLADFIDRLDQAAIMTGHPGAHVLGVKSLGNGVQTEGAEKLAGIVDFQPSHADLVTGIGATSKLAALAKRVLPNKIYQAAKIRVSAVKRVPYNAVVERKRSQMKSGAYTHLPCVFPSWDNSPRRASALVIQNDDPESFTNWVRAARAYLQTRPEGDQILFVNAWNEWAEGCHLEPDLQLGHSFLAALKAGLTAPL